MLNDRLKESNDRFGELQRLTSAILDRSIVIHAHCKAGFDPFVVFSTLNATGLELTATQILRARSLGLVDPLSTQVKQATDLAWNSIERLGSGKNREKEPDRFLQTYLVLREGLRIQLKEVVRKFDTTALKSRKLPSSRQAQEEHFGDLARELNTLVPIYAALAEGTWPEVVPPSDEWHKNRVKLLIKVLGVKQLLPLLVATASRHPSDFIRVLDVMERAVFVSLVCFENQTKWGDKTFELAKAIYEDALTVDELVTSVQDYFARQLTPSPAARLAARLPELLRYNGRRKTWIRYFLTTINDWGFPGSPSPTSKLHGY